MGHKLTNNAVATLAASITDIATSCTVASGAGAKFPALSAGDYFWATLVDSSGNIEIVKVTARATDTMTIVRGQDTTTARSFPSGSKFELRVAAALFTNIPQLDTPNTFAQKQTMSAGADITGPITLAGNAIGGNATYNGNIAFNGANTFAGANSFAQIPTIAGRKIDAFDAGTKIVLQQSTAPTGWTRDTTHNNKAMRVVSGAVGSGGDISFTAAFGDRMIARTNLPNVTLSGTTNPDGGHDHNMSGTYAADGSSPSGSTHFMRDGTAAGGYSDTTDVQPVGDHTHTFTTTSINGGVTQTPMDFNVQYLDFGVFAKAA